MANVGSRLGAVVTLRRQVEEERRRLCAAAAERLDAARAAARALERRRGQALDELAQCQNRIHPAELRLWHQAIQYQAERLERAAATANALEVEYEAERALLAQAVRERQAVERLEAKRRLAYAERQRRLEQARWDEIAGRRVRSGDG